MSKSGQEEEGKFETKFEHDIILGSKRKKNPFNEILTWKLFYTKDILKVKLTSFQKKRKSILFVR